MFKRIVVGLDGSDPAGHALPMACELAREYDGRLEIVHVRELRAPSKGGGPATARADEDDLEARVRREVDELARQGFTVRLHTFSDLVGTPAEHIADVAAETHADVVVVGTRGLGVIAGLLLGSVTQRLLHVAPCPVLAVPPPDRRRQLEMDREEKVASGVAGSEVRAGRSSG
jgi:nucleotide-binding universal stress UspA family protein